MSHDPALAPLPAIDRTGAVTRALAQFTERSAPKSGDRLPIERHRMPSLAGRCLTAREARLRDASRARDRTCAILAVVEEEIEAMSE